MSKHTAEPWELRGDSIYASPSGFVMQAGQDGFFKAERGNANAARAAACVNALAGIPDPVAALKLAREVLAALSQCYVANRSPTTDEALMVDLALAALNGQG